MGLGVHVGIDPHAHGCAHAHLAGHFVQHIEFRTALHVEAANTHLEGLPHLGACLAHTGEDDLAGNDADGQRTFQLATRDDVQPATRLHERVQDGERRVGLHRVTDQVLAPRQSPLVGTQCIQHGCLAVDEQGCAMFLCQLSERHTFQRELTLLVAEEGRQCGG